MLTWMREANDVISATKGLTEADLDHLFDANANTIGALMLHLAAAETYYQMNTFDGMKWGSWPESVKKQWDAAMGLGEGPTNNYCKWFHVCEHEAHHTGQIALLRKRLPGAKPDSE
jgi:uncharacterized damage-inducible protein DinB